MSRNRKAGKNQKDYPIRDCYREGGYVFAKKPGGTAGETEGCRIARLASNENPDPPSEAAINRGTAALACANRYPDEKMTDLRAALRDHYGNFEFVTGVGMDGVIETTIRTVVDPGDRVVISTPTFSFYRLASIAQGADVCEVPRSEGFSVDETSFADACSGSKLAFLCTPNNPTGNATAVDVIRRILERIDCLLFLDNAYVEFSGLDYTPLMHEFENLIIGRTFSKAYSLAGLRVGYAFVPSWFSPFYTRAATPHTLNAVSAAAAAGALSDQEHVRKIEKRVAYWRSEMARRIRKTVMPTDANFIMVDVSPLTSDGAADRIAESGVMVRSCRSFRGIPDHFVRVSIGDDWENEMVIAALNRL
jgi:histidinol-phosphate aminotransferase